MHQVCGILELDRCERYLAAFLDIHMLRAVDHDLRNILVLHEQAKRPQAHGGRGQFPDQARADLERDLDLRFTAHLRDRIIDEHAQLVLVHVVFNLKEIRTGDQISVQPPFDLSIICRKRFHAFFSYLIKKPATLSISPIRSKST